MAWHFALEEADLTWDSPGGSDPSATSRPTTQQLGFSGHGFGAGTSPGHPCGTISVPSTDTPGVASWRSSLLDFPARISHLQEAGRAWKASAPRFSSRSCGWPKKRSPRSYSLRTSPASEHADSVVLGENWPLTATIVDGVLYPLQTWEIASFASAGSVWPTPTVFGNGNSAGYGGKSGDGLATAASRRWPAAMAADGGRHSPAVRHKAGNQTLTSDALKWATVKSSPSGPDYARSSREGSGGDDLTTQVAKWATATTRDHRSLLIGPKTIARGNARPLSEQLGTLISDGRHSHLGPTTSKDGPPTSRPSLVLNPRFVEALMGWPIGWTRFDSLAEGWFLSRRRWRGKASYTGRRKKTTGTAAESPAQAT